MRSSRVLAAIGAALLGGSAQAQEAAAPAVQAAVEEAKPAPVAAEAPVSASPAVPTSQTGLTDQTDQTGPTTAPGSTDLVGHAAGNKSISLKALGRISGGAVGGIALDDLGNRVSPAPFESRLGLKLTGRWQPLAVVVDAELLRGASALPATDFPMGATSHPAMQAFDVRQAYGEYRGETFVIRAGEMASHWGLGLVANDGAHESAPGEFGEPRFGDLTYRAAVAGRPFFGLGGAWRAIEPALAIDLVRRDDTAAYADGDRALQGVLLLRFKVDDDRQFGVYTVYRRQRAVGHDETSRSTDAFVLDLAGNWQWDLAQGQLRLGAEAALITGTSTLTRSDTAPEQSLEQFGAAVKAAYRRGALEGLLDLGYASGDQNPYDDAIESFRFDPDFGAGVVLFQEVLGWQSARAAGRATDPMLLAQPPDGADLLASRGSISGAAYAFPRLRWSALEWLDVYGGPLLAVTTARLTDPFQTRVRGGEPRNYLGGRAGSYLGTELDLGARAHYEPVSGLHLSLTAEGGWLLPGGALADAAGNPMDSVAAARVRLAVGF